MCRSTLARVRVLIAAAVVASALSAAAADEAATLGRIFLTPEQRRLLDEQRSNRGVAGPASASAAGGGTGSQRVVLNGVVQRGAEPASVWINGQPAEAAAISGNGVRTRRGRDAQGLTTVEIVRDGARVRLKPGQTWDLASGRVLDCAQCVQPSPAAAADLQSEPAPPADAQEQGSATASPDEKGDASLKSRARL
jgi:hypothetical protein